MANQKVAVVRGSSSGIGLETSLLLAKNGFQTFSTMRNADKGRDLSAQVVLKAVMAQDPEFRYLAGKDVGAGLP